MFSNSGENCPVEIICRGIVKKITQVTWEGWSVQKEAVESTKSTNNPHSLLESGDLENIDHDDQEKIDVDQ